VVKAVAALSRGFQEAAPRASSGAKAMACRAPSTAPSAAQGLHQGGQVSAG